MAKDRPLRPKRPSRNIVIKAHTLPTRLYVEKNDDFLSAFDPYQSHQCVIHEFNVSSETSHFASLPLGTERRVAVYELLGWSTIRTVVDISEVTK